MSKRHNIPWGDQWGDANLHRRHTDKLTREPVGNPLAVLAFLFVMCMAVFGAIALATGWVPHR